MLELSKLKSKGIWSDFKQGVGMAKLYEGIFWRFENLGFDNLPWVDTVEDELGELLVLSIVIGMRGTDVFDV